MEKKVKLTIEVTLELDDQASKNDIKDIIKGLDWEVTSNNMLGVFVKDESLVKAQALNGKTPFIVDEEIYS